ncbi:mRNA cleavage and polyadenylation factor subunit [Exophiala dermatitidis]|uniref:Histone H2A n=2 Tax=Exophiala dermatitidis TaxID=5970 RepID=H6C8W5_EXODN|nr:histone H2A [Exophiala dermatitidis NIH/UT8656]KAJ4523652.1 mRNA cleavage and polyadenylation factor subunit [Exophiala dermatitidis]EHY60542.1 histone H2A [Exophiala dermatitidis NIH/UT8656]KAJ4524675.1 mRNA cleavage and polyadenylation factor subunit [Exophiala dermatitidis]KAJ4527547.1 mRNA cleavage and polyadenylation factor subunit [Exophiala dermatitidis]KAJ4531121.1 mRNA cleavage and polyadenylation factor subunit [Exophiala dermatitidis]
MQCYTELIPPTGVTHALAVPFTSSKGDDLLVARTSLLQIFRCKQNNHGSETKLVLVAEYNLAGTITSLGRVKIPNSKSGGDAVLVAFRDAKLSLIEWDPALHSISTLSIHYYEHHDLQSIPWQPDLSKCVSHLTVDPSSRCAAFNFGVSNLAIIPLHQVRDELAMDEFDEVDGEVKERLSPDGQNENKHDSPDTPFKPSFVLPLTALDPGLLHPVDMAFLHEYRDPTVGILYSTAARSSNMNHERRDVTIYAVYALDIGQKASTALQSVQKLPNDLYRVMALPPPVGGALLIGGNELIHIDQSGKTIAIAVNELAKEASSFPMADHANYRLKLEGCQIEHLGNPSGDMLVILKTGELALLSFRMDGRMVSSMALRRVGEGQSQGLALGASTCSTNLGSNRLFIGSEESDSILLATGRKTTQLRRTNSRIQSQADDAGLFDDNEEDGIEDEDDLYAELADELNGNASTDVSGHNFRLLDRLPSIAPINDVALANVGKRRAEESEVTRQELAVAYGRGHAGGLAFLSRKLEPSVTRQIKFERPIGVWCFSSGNRGQQGAEEENFDDLVMISQTTDDGAGRTKLLRLIDGDLNSMGESEFDESAGAAIGVFKLEATNHTIQVLPTELRVYDAGFALSQIFPIVDEEEGQTARAVKVSFVDPYLVVVKDDGSMSLLKADKAGELDEVELPENLRAWSILSATLYQDTDDMFQTSRFYNGTATPGPILTILTQDGHFCLLSLPNVSIQVFQCDSLPFLPTHLMQDLQLPKHWRNKDDLGEVLLADLGNSTDRQPYLVVRNLVGDVIIYESFAMPDVLGSFRFKKVFTKAAGELEDGEEVGQPSTLQPMQAVTNVAGHASVFIPGRQPLLIMREASTMPRVYELNPTKLKSMNSVHTGTCRQGLVLVDADDEIKFCNIPDSTVLGLSDWVIRRVPLGQDITSVAYFAPTDSYILATNHTTEFQLPQDDEWHPEWQGEATKFLPSSIQSSLKLLSAKTHSIISQYSFDACERVLCLESLNLEVSEETHERKDLIVVGTAIVKGENVTTRGNLYIFDVVDVVPEPDRPESDLKIKLITKEDVRGAVSALCDIGSQGFLLAAQGQKSMVRGLKEDMSILPVAFLDMRYYVHVARELPGTGLCILGDAFSGLWLVGYSEEPYKLQILGRDLEDPPVLAAEFLPDGKQLYIISSDDDGLLRVLQYDPENPKAERGTKLLLRSTFHSGAAPTKMILLPPQVASGRGRDPEIDMDVDSGAGPAAGRHRILVTTQEGSLCMLTPLSEATYRRLSALQTTLLTTLDFHPCSLNPRAYRQVETDGIGGRGIIDGNYVQRWWETSTQQRVASADKAGASVWEVRADMDLISCRDLEFR